MFSSKCAFPCLKKGCWNSMTELFSAVIMPFSRAITFLKPSAERCSQSHFLQCKADCDNTAKENPEATEISTLTGSRSCENSQRSFALVLGDLTALICTARENIHHAPSDLAGCEQHARQRPARACKQDSRVHSIAEASQKWDLLGHLEYHPDPVEAAEGCTFPFMSIIPDHCVSKQMLPGTTRVYRVASGRELSSWPTPSHARTRGTFSIPDCLRETARCQLYFHHGFKYHRADASWQTNLELSSFKILA